MLVLSTGELGIFLPANIPNIRRTASSQALLVYLFFTLTNSYPHYLCLYPGCEAKVEDVETLVQNHYEVKHKNVAQNPVGTLETTPTNVYG